MRLSAVRCGCDPRCRVGAPLASALGRARRSCNGIQRCWAKFTAALALASVSGIQQLSISICSLPSPAIQRDPTAGFSSLSHRIFLVSVHMLPPLHARI